MHDFVPLRICLIGPGPAMLACLAIGAAIIVEEMLVLVAELRCKFLVVRAGCLLPHPSNFVDVRNMTLHSHASVSSGKVLYSQSIVPVRLVTDKD
jgi:hypothetical protein